MCSSCLYSGYLISYVTGIIKVPKETTNVYFLIKHLFWNLKRFPTAQGPTCNFQYNEILGMSETSWTFFTSIGLRQDYTTYILKFSYCARTQMMGLLCMKERQMLGSNRNKLWLMLCQAHIQLKFLADQILPSLDWILEYKR